MQCIIIVGGRKLNSLCALFVTWADSYYPTFVDFFADGAYAELFRENSSTPRSTNDSLMTIREIAGGTYCLNFWYKISQFVLLNVHGIPKSKRVLRWEEIWAKDGPKNWTLCRTQFYVGPNPDVS